MLSRSSWNHEFIGVFFWGVSGYCLDQTRTCITYGFFKGNWWFFFLVGFFIDGCYGWWDWFLRAAITIFIITFFFEGFIEFCCALVWSIRVFAIFRRVWVRSGGWYGIWRVREVFFFRVSCFQSWFEGCRAWSIMWYI